MDSTIQRTTGWNGLLPFSKALFQETYFLRDEDYEGWKTRMSQFSKNEEQAERIKSYLDKYWFVPSTPISSNGGTDRGMPIACMEQHIGDSRKSIFNSWTEAAWTGSEGTGLGRYWGDVRGIGAKVSTKGESSGVIPFMGVDEAITKAVSQGSIRRMSISDYLPVWHPEIMEFIGIRTPEGDPSRKAPELHHGVVIDDVFMKAVISGSDYNLVCPHTKEVVDTVKARDVWIKILEVRTTIAGEPYLLFIDNVNKNLPPEYIKLGLEISTSNLCNEIMQYTAPDYTVVCDLASVNVEHYNEWRNNKLFITDVNDFLDEVMSDFIRRTEGKEGFENARKAAINERNIGIGVMGLHYLYQSKSLPFGSPMAYGLNREIFKFIRTTIDEYQASLPVEELCPMSIKAGTHRRNILCMANAPTMSIATLANVTTSGIEPLVANAFTKKVKQGSFTVKNRYLEEIINHWALDYRHPANSVGTEQDKEQQRNTWKENQWASIKKNNGSVQHLEWMDDWNKDVFKTAFEIDQTVLIAQAGDRQEFIDQGQSLNIFMPGGSDVQSISDLHIYAWKVGCKGMYYLRSLALSRASTESGERKKINVITLDDLTEDSCKGCS